MTVLVCPACLLTDPTREPLLAEVQVNGTLYCRQHGMQAMQQAQVGGPGRPLRMRPAAS